MVAAVKEMLASKRWVLDSVPRLHERHLQALALGQGSDLPPVQAPAAAPVAVPQGAPPALVGALVLEAFPPRGVVHLLEKQHTQVGGRAGRRVCCLRSRCPWPSAISARGAACSTPLAARTPRLFNLGHPRPATTTAGRAPAAGAPGG